jgi:hypothetical protein
VPKLWPTPVAEFTSGTADDLFAVLYVSPAKADIGEVMRRMLMHFTDAAIIVWDPATKRLLGTTDQTLQTSILAAWAEDQWGGNLVIEPKTGETGAVTRWQLVSDSLGRSDVTDRAANDYNRRTFYATVNMVLNDLAAVSVDPMVLVDQVNGVMHFKSSDASFSPALWALTMTGQTVCVHMGTGGQGGMAFE